MDRWLKMSFLPIIFILLSAGCATVSVHKMAATTDLKKCKHLYVEHRLADGRGLDALMTQELQRLGYDVSFGPLTMMPPTTDAIISYEDRWAWDFSSYMIELNVLVRDARTGQTLVTVTNFHPSFMGKAPEDMVRIALAPIFKPR